MKAVRQLRISATIPSRPGIRSRSRLTSSTRGRIGRPTGIPCQGLLVSPIQSTARLVPIPALPRDSCCFSPSPNASRSSSATEPQAIDAIVSTARFFCTRDEARKS